MTLGQNPFNPYRSLPTLAAINRRGRELHAYQARQEAAEPATAAAELPAEYPAYLPEESRPLDDQQEPQDLQLSYPGNAYQNEYPEPSVPPPPRPSALQLPALAVAALYGIAGRIVNNLTPHTEADPAAILLQFLAAFGVWDYCSLSARLLFDNAPIDPTARRISQALDVTPEGLSRVQIRALFNRHVSKERIDLALGQLHTLGLINRETTAGRGRSATLWAKVQNPETVTGDLETDPYGA